MAQTCPLRRQPFAGLPHLSLCEAPGPCAGVVPCGRGSAPIGTMTTPGGIMSTTNAPTWNDWIGATIVDSDGDKIGTLETIYMDRSTGQPEWLAVKTGMFGMRQT